MIRAFERLYRTNERPVHRYLAHHLRVAEDVDDLTADVFASAWRAYGHYRDTGAELPWLYRIARNRLIDHARARHAPTLPLDGCDSIPDGTDDYAASDEAAAMGEVLATLTDAQRVVLTLRFLEDRPSAEIAPLMHRDVEAVKKLQQRGLAALRRSFAADAIAQAEDDLGCAALPRPHRHPRRLEAR